MTASNEKVLEAFKPFEQFCKAMLDAYIVINADGKILKSNSAAALVTGYTSKQLLRIDSLNSALSLSISGKPVYTSDILIHSSPTRIDDLIGITTQGSELNLTIGYYPFVDEGTVIGAFLLIRDVTAETQLQGKYKDKASKSITDPLTGLFNRAHFEDYLNTEEKRIVGLPNGSDHRNLSVIMGDIDHFKKINDKYGHLAGDFIIKTVAGILQKTVRKTDIVCRYGGEEFLVILPASDCAGAKIAAEKLRQTIESHVFDFDGHIIPVTMSLGVAQFQVDQETTTDTIARADTALYQSKQQGRNTVRVHNGHDVVAAA
jgi:diguanylate cyclase (GGDEF)-like protein/PAS domain S-box-containing protein